MTGDLLCVGGGSAPRASGIAHLLGGVNHDAFCRMNLLSGSKWSCKSSLHDKSAHLKAIIAFAPCHATNYSSQNP